MMVFYGTIDFVGDEQRNRVTYECNFELISDWYQSVIEHYEGELKYAPRSENKVQEIVISVFLATERVKDNPSPCAAKSLSNPYAL